MAAKRIPAGIRNLAKKSSAPTSPALRTERANMLSLLRPIVDVIGVAMGRNVEVVLHDLTQPESSVIRIVNGNLSGRQVGDSILSGPDKDKGFLGLLRDLGEGDDHAPHSLISEYQTLTRSGKTLRSATVIFRDSQDIVFASLCINTDTTAIAAAAHVLQGMLGAQHASPEVPRNELGIEALMNAIITESVNALGKPVSAMDKDEKVQVVDTMMQRGLFIVKGGVEHAAAALGVTRFTIYNYLDVLRVRDVG